ncbi:unnamed protein product [Prorocentrum cordatum]|uniref:Uncharacterized protein n=1 Tax=Prorocentrum cordatum TaxID=2364126 RepID=A0ABN9VT16_9DINO|nr:unnamed protein product [Polarella glacialis]
MIVGLCSQVLSSAYDILSDPEKFKKWEASGRGGGGRPGPGESSRGGSSESARRQQQRWEEQRAWEARRARQQAGRGGAQDSDLSAAAFAVGKAAAVAAGIAGAAVGAAGKAVQAAAGPGVAGQGITGLAGAAGRAVGFAGAAGKSVLDSVSPRASRIAKMKLDELLEFIGQAPTPPAGAPRAAASGDLRAEEAEAERLQARVDSLRRDQDSWEEQARALNSSGDRRGELEALRRALQAKDAGRAARAELFACYDRIDAARGAPRP